MDDSNLAELRRLINQRQKTIFEAIKAGIVAELPHESQLEAQAMQEHMHLKHVHNAIEFADLREGVQYEITVAGEPVNPLAHVAAHAAVKGQIEQDPLVRAAFEKITATGTSAHHAEHVLSAILLETYWDGSKAAESGENIDKAQRVYKRKLQKLIRDWDFRKKLTRQFTADHSAFE
jgi:hypothetical protein